MIAPIPRPRAEDVLQHAIQLRAEIERVAQRLNHPSPPAFYQDFIVHILERPHRFGTGPLTPGLIVHAAKCLVIADRRRSRSIPTSCKDVEECSAKPDASKPRAESKDIRRVRHALDRLRPRAREIVERRVLYHETSGQIAKELGITASGVRSSLKLSLMRLKRLLSDSRGST